MSDFPKAHDAKKIIATTDSSLRTMIPDMSGFPSYLVIPSIPQSFIDKYVNEYNKGNKIEDAMVEYGLSTDRRHLLKFNPNDNTINIEQDKPRCSNCGKTLYDCDSSCFYKEDETKTSWTRGEVEKTIRKFRNEVFDGEDERLTFDEEYFNKWIETNL